MTHKYNKGEWSELYAFLYALSNGEIFGADENLNRDIGVKYDVLSVFQKGNEYKRDLMTSNINFEIDNILYSVSISDFIVSMNNLFSEIKHGKGQTFEILSIESFIDELGIKSLKASSKSKGDLTIKVHDTFTNTRPLLNFSVKSYIGNKPTLLNSSTATRFDFRLSKNLTKDEIDRINNISTGSKIVDRINEMKKTGVDLIYEDLSSPIFKNNLQMIDYRMPEILAYLYLESYFVRGKRLPDVINSFTYNSDSEDKVLIEYKVRQLLIACALGLVPNTLWLGTDEATGGYLVVKDNADVLCYHIYNRNKLSDYLFNHTSFDTPSTGRHAVGEIYIGADGVQRFSLNIQIRFI